MTLLHNLSACMPISYLLKREYLFIHRPHLGWPMRHASLWHSVKQSYSFLFQVPLLPAACMNLCQGHWLPWGHTPETTPPKALNFSCFSLQPKRRLLTNHWRALTCVEAMSGLHFSGGFSGKTWFFAHLFQGKGTQHDYVVILRKHINQMQSVEGPNSKWVVRLRGRLWRL